MSAERCPRCGKVIDRVSDQRHAEKRMTPRYFRFACCSHCGGYYGQDIGSRYVKVCLYGALCLLVLGGLLQNGYLALLCIPAALCAIFTPLVPMDENEKAVKSQRPLYHGVFEGEILLSRWDCYMLTPDFDSYDSFTAVSPIQVVSVDRKSAEIEFFFLYDHHRNDEAVSNGSFNLYGQFGEAVGIIASVGRR